MGRTQVRRVGSPRTRRTIDGFVLVAGAIVLLFAVVGVASAGKYVADKASGSKSATPTVTTRGGTSLASAAITRAHAQATAIVQAANQSKKSIITQARTRARSQANQILTQARRSASKTIASAKANTPPVSSPSSNSTGGTGGTSSISPSSGSVAAAPFPTPTYTAPQTTTGAVLAPALQNTPIGSPNLSTVPSSWLVVGYNATFGNGPGSAGSVSIVNRSRSAFSGTVKVVYAHGGVAYAPFHGLASGQSMVLPLNGPKYPGGGFTIQVVV